MFHKSEKMPVTWHFKCIINDNTAYFVMKLCHLIGEGAVFVHQEAEPPLLLQQCLPAAVCYELLHVCLPRRNRLQILKTKVSY